LGHASRIGFQLRVRGVRDHQEIAAVLREEYARGAMGAIIGKLPYEEQVIQLPIWKHFSVISVGRFGWEHTFHNVRPSIFGPCRQALTLLWERGYRRIGCVLYTHHPPHPDDHARFGAVLDFQHRITPEHRVPILEIDDAPNREQFCNWVKTHRPDCILSFFHAHGEILREMGYRLPEDLGFFTLHLNDRVKLDCSGFRQNRQLIGKTALRKLSELLRHGERGRPDSPETTLIEPTLMEGITC
jgi:LacI family transcriptional regulator